MDQKGAIIHWIIFGVLAAFALFFLASRASQTTLPMKGAWSIDFVQDLYLPAELRLLKIDAVAKNVGSELAIELAQHGGFAAGIDSPCGRIRDANAWNSEAQWCIPDVSATLAQRAVAMLSSRLEGKAFNAVQSKGTFFLGKSNAEQIKNPQSLYTFNTGFAVDMGYAFEEHAQLHAEAKQMVELCRDERDLAACLIERKPEHWKYGTCALPDVTLPLETRRIPFCVDSPGKYRVSISPDLSPLFWDVQYAIALDFTPLLPLPLEETRVGYNPQLNAFDLRFERDTGADKYTIYFGNDALLILGSGPASEVFQPDQKGPNPWWDAVSFKSTDAIIGTAECITDGIRETNKAHVCGGEMLYTLADNRVTTAEQLVFAITTHRGTKESQIRKVVLGRK